MVHLTQGHISHTRSAKVNQYNTISDGMLQGHLQVRELVADLLEGSHDAAPRGLVIDLEGVVIAVVGGPDDQLRGTTPQAVAESQIGKLVITNVSQTFLQGVGGPAATKSTTKRRFLSRGSDHQYAMNHYKDQNLMVAMPNNGGA